jgi:hypothetical protein
MAISKQRQGELALMYLKNKLRHEGVTIKPNMQRQAANEAKELGISPEEAAEFAEMLVRDIVEEAFKK